MSYAVWSGYKNEVITIYPGMDHAHSKDQKYCQMCVQNKQEAVTKSIYRWVRSYNKILELNIQTAMIKIFEPLRNKTKQTVPPIDESKNRTKLHIGGKHRKS